MLIGQQIGPFEIEGEIGSGAMGTVYKAKFHKDGKVIPVALKVVALGLVGNEGAMARFEREAAILKQLRHPHIVRLYGAGKYKQTPFIAMEFVDGESLDKVLGRRGRMSWEDVAVYAKQLCAALQHAHEKGIIHRDLKPSNLMVTPDGSLKLTDFGIAKDTDVTSLTGANSTIGTAAYMSPEQCKGDRNISAKSDLYSLGIVLYELVTGKKPFVAENTVEMFLKHVHEKPVRPGKLVPDLPVWMDNLIMFLLEKEKDKRPLDATTVARMLAEIEEKVSAQQSVGAEVANARRVDRPIRGEGLDESDLQLARSIRSPGKRRKKKGAAWYQRTWVRAVGLWLGLLAVFAVGGYLLWQQLRPLSIDERYALVERASGSEAKLKAAEDFLKAYGNAPDPRVEEVRAAFREQKARATEEVLQKRFTSKFKANSEGFDKDAYELAIQAMDAEKAGDLVRAAGLWSSVRDRSPKADPARLLDEAEAARLGWVAEKRLREIQQVPETLRRLRKQLEDDRAFEVERSYGESDPEGLAVQGLRLEAFGDKAKARTKWDQLLSQTEKDADERVWYLVAAQQAAQSVLPKEGDPKAGRLKLLETRIGQLESNWKTVQADPEARLARRDIRNACRDVIDLYGDETDDAIKAVVARAKTLLESVPK